MTYSNQVLGADLMEKVMFEHRLDTRKSAVRVSGEGCSKKREQPVQRP